MFYNRRHNYWRYALDLEASSAIGGMLHFLRHITFFEACLRFGGIFCNLQIWRHAMILEECYVFGALLRFWRHAMFLKACMTNCLRFSIAASIRPPASSK